MTDQLTGLMSVGVTTHKKSVMRCLQFVLVLVFFVSARPDLCTGNTMYNVHCLIVVCATIFRHLMIHFSK